MVDVNSYDMDHYYWPLEFSFQSWKALVKLSLVTVCSYGLVDGIVSDQKTESKKAFCPVMGYLGRAAAWLL